MAYAAEVKFISDPPGYVNEVLIPSLDGQVKCKGDRCQFPFANRTYWMNALFMIIGVILLFLLGLVVVYLLAFPFGFFQKIRNCVSSIYDTLCCKFSKQKSMDQDIGNNDEKELIEVGEEREAVHEITRPFIVSEDSDTILIDHDKIPPDTPPVVTKKLRKIYPALGGRPPKVALSSLDLHVRKGQVLGLLGKNGAGKTTALKILSGAHEASGGLALIGGSELDEKTKVSSKLGYCSQFDVVYKSRSVQHHLEFFARMKGLPREEVKDAARSAATAVGLGSHEVYPRNAGALSGGMRRRLSIAMSLLGSPDVLVLDEPTTGLDPSTRNGKSRFGYRHFKMHRNTID